MKLKLPTLNINGKGTPMPILKFLFALVLVIQINGQHVYSQTHLDNDAIPVEILSKSIMYPQLWKESTLAVNSVNTIYILNHGIEALNDLSLNLKFNNKPVVLINKGDIDSLGDSPYFLVHTLNVEESKATVRIYMAYVLNGQRNTSSLVEIAFIKSNDHWEITNSQI